VAKHRDVEQTSLAQPVPTEISPAAFLNSGAAPPSNTADMKNIPAIPFSRFARDPAPKTAGSNLRSTTQVLAGRSPTGNSIRLRQPYWIGGMIDF
jgi:hypothetical protein